ncbi:MAG: hypothetical protein FMNOHCHN_01614 [Ignavibacteriaceae bacterium]|nr:hypothetical protein [Ignavibacteriaceae bacterium]
MTLIDLINGESFPTLVINDMETVPVHPDVWKALVESMNLAENLLKDNPAWLAVTR